MSSEHVESGRRSASPDLSNLSDVERNTIVRGPRYVDLTLGVNRIKYYATPHAFDGNKWIAPHLRQLLLAIYDRLKNVRQDYWGYFRKIGPSTNSEESYAQLIVDKLAELADEVAKDVRNTRPRTEVGDIGTGVCSHFTFDVVRTRSSLCFPFLR